MPRDIKELHHLEQLHLDNNLLEFVPDELTTLRTLKVLSLAHNKITHVTTAFCETARFKV
jgi:Leucine-rich repeat (LRR) protein